MASTDRAHDRILVDVQAESPDSLADYAAIPIAFEVRTILECTIVAHGLGGLALSEHAVATPWRKDYDLLDGGPARWAARDDVAGWDVLAARVDGLRVGGAIVAGDGLHLLDGRPGVAILRDIRVAPAMRGRGVGAALFRAAADRARARGARELAVETQNVNVAACRFYARMGCALAAIQRFAYPALPDETLLLWVRDLSASRSPAAARTG